MVADKTQSWKENKKLKTPIKLVSIVPIIS